MRTTPLEGVQDIVHPFWLCPACSAENTSVLMANAADYRIMLVRIAANAAKLRP